MVTSNQYSYAMTDTYLDIFRNCNVEQIVDFPTRGNKTLYVFLTSNPGLIDRCKPMPGVGDHDAVLIDTLIKPRRTKSTRRTTITECITGYSIYQQVHSNTILNHQRHVDFFQRQHTQTSRQARTAQAD
jgi:hypothetical protein